MKKIKKCIALASLCFAGFSLSAQNLTELKQKYSEVQNVNGTKVKTASTDITKFSDSLKSFDSSELDSDSTTSIIPNPQVAMAVSYYPVTAGDVYTLGFAVGTTPVTYTIPVDSTYKIRIANMGVINCAGLTYLQLKTQVEALVLRNYPMGGVQFVLTTPSVFLVNIVGEVEQTVIRNAWALTRLSTLVKRSLTAFSSIREITIESADGTKNNYDLFMAMRKGDLSQDPFLRPDDKIIVNRAKRIVTIDGAVERPGTYEILEGENLKELIEIYGNGLEPLADTSRIEITRNTPGEKSSGKKSYLTKADIDSNYVLESYDFVTVQSYSDFRPVVFVEGAINADVDTELETSSRIPAPFVPGEDYAFFARRNKEWFTATSDLSKAYVIRDGQTFALNLNPILYDSDYYTTEKIQPNDTLVIPFKQFFVSVAGSVVKPGRYPYIPDRTWEYYIGLAGGFDKTKNSREAIKIMDINGKKLTKNDFITPECTITASTNSALYYFNQYAPVVTTTLTAIVSFITVKSYIDSKK